MCLRTASGLRSWILCLRHKMEAKAAHPLLSSRPQGRQKFHPLFSDALFMV